MLRSFLAACIAASLVLLCPLNLRAQSGPWAHSSPQLKGEALVRDADGGDLREMRLIVQGGGDVNWQLSPTGLTPLMAAASADHLEVVQFLIEHGADPSMRDSNGFPALERAQRYGANDVVRYLERL
ncbi:MAG: ankyrin repeat domain-containing protein, partial [Gemmatimonadaceae bacterium]|nr:ankyrin repeat domain-containing protein [Gemmatimonadaceae bacterium]